LINLVYPPAYKKPEITLLRAPAVL
jgi:hypothetical protein